LLTKECPSKKTVARAKSSKLQVTKVHSNVNSDPASSLPPLTAVTPVTLSVTPEKKLTSPSARDHATISNTLADRKNFKRKRDSASPPTSSSGDDGRKKLKSFVVSPEIKAADIRTSNRAYSASSSRTVKKNGAVRSEMNDGGKDKREDKSSRKSKEGEPAKRLTPPSRKRESGQAKWLWFDEPQMKPILTQVITFLFFILLLNGKFMQML